jgi:hypothetical protein
MLPMTHNGTRYSPVRRRGVTLLPGGPTGRSNRISDLAPTAAQLGGGRIECDDDVGSLPLKGGGQEGVGRASTTFRDKRRRQGSGRCVQLDGPPAVAPTPSCPPPSIVPFRGRDPAASSRSGRQPSSARGSGIRVATCDWLALRGRGNSLFLAEGSPGRDR